MNTHAKRRLLIATGLIVIVAVVILAILGSNSAARTVSVSEAADLAGDAKIQVTGNVVKNSFDIDGDVLNFQIYDSEADPEAAKSLPVRYDGGVSATFGNDVTAICTGKKDANGVLVCSELVTKCPSKYEDAKGSLSVTEFLNYGDKVVDKHVLLSGVIGNDGIASVQSQVRFVLTEPNASASVPVHYEGALPDDMTAGARVVLSGSVDKNGVFNATNVAYEA